MSKQTSLDRYALFYEAVGAPNQKSATKPAPNPTNRSTSQSTPYATGGLNQDQVDKLAEDLQSLSKINRPRS